MIIDYAGLLIATRQRSLKIEELLQNEKWAEARDLQFKQCTDEFELANWIANRSVHPMVQWG